MPAKSRFPIPEYVQYKVVFSSEQLEIVYLPELDGMMMNHLGDASHEEYKTAFLSLIALMPDYPWKVSMSNEIWLRHIPTQTQIWAGTRFALMPGVRKILQMNTEVVTISAKNTLGQKLAKLFHGMLRQVTGLDLHTFPSLEEAFGYQAQKYGTPEVKAKYAEKTGVNSRTILSK